MLLPWQDQADSADDEPKPSVILIKRPCGCAARVPPLVELSPYGTLAADLRPQGSTCVGI